MKPIFRSVFDPDVGVENLHMKKINVMIVDDHLVVREGLRQLLELEDDIEVVAEAGSGLECLEILEDSCPDLIFMDIRMPGINGIETTRLVCRQCPDTKIIMLTIYQDNQHIAEAIQAGAKGYVLKDVKRENLINIIHHVIQDGAFLDPAVASELFDHIKNATTTSMEGEKPRFTRRELEVLKLLVDGRKDREISEFLYISEHTVRSHIKSLFRKLGVSSRSQAVAKAIQGNLITNGR